jgi:hypothetical protein
MKGRANRDWLVVVLFVTLSPCHPVTLSFAAAEVPAKVWTEEEWTQRVERLRPGMTIQQVRDLLGDPRRIARQVLYQRYLEQWVYESPLPLRLEFDCRRGQPPALLPLPAAGAPSLPGKRGLP